MPLSVLEAMSIGLPVVLSNCVGNRDLVENKDFLYQDKQNAVKIINYYIKNEKLLAEQSLKSKEIFNKNFKLENMADLYYRLYRSLYV